MSSDHWSYFVLRYLRDARNAHKINIRNKPPNSDHNEFLLLSAHAGDSCIILPTDDQRPGGPQTAGLEVPVERQGYGVAYFLLEMQGECASIQLPLQYLQEMCGGVRSSLQIRQQLRWEAELCAFLQVAFVYDYVSAQCGWGGSLGGCQGDQ